jgi:polar amino acid transport system ATP-binding protein
MNVLEVKNLSKTIGNTQILKSVNFNMDKGNVISIIGSSGSGKTTLLRCVNLLEVPTSGEIKVNGNEYFNSKSFSKMSDAEIRNKRLQLGLVFQNFNLFPQYTALENILLAPLLKKNVNKEELQNEALMLLDSVGLKDKANNYPHQLSGGQQQRVAIARALILHPDILCFDEPTSALDPELTGEVLKVIKDLAGRNWTMLIVTHEMAFAKEVSDKIIFMDDGEIVEESVAADFFTNPKTDRAKKFLSNYNNN